MAIQRLTMELLAHRTRSALLAHPSYSEHSKRSRFKNDHSSFQLKGILPWKWPILSLCSWKCDITTLTAVQELKKRYSWKEMLDDQSYPQRNDGVCTDCIIMVYSHIYSMFSVRILAFMILQSRTNYIMVNFPHKLYHDMLAIQIHYKSLSLHPFSWMTVKPSALVD